MQNEKVADNEFENRKSNGHRIHHFHRKRPPWPIGENVTAREIRQEGKGNIPGKNAQVSVVGITSNADCEGGNREKDHYGSQIMTFGKESDYFQSLGFR